MIKNLRASSLKWLKTSKSMARIYKIKRKDTVSGTKKWHVTTETASITRVKESYEQLHANNLKKTISRSVTGIDKIQQVDGSQIRQGLRQVEFKFYLEGSREPWQGSEQGGFMTCT